MKWTIEAVLKSGVICPQEPLPPEWSEGSELAVQLIRTSEEHEENGEEPELNGEVARLEQEDWQAFQATLDQMHREAKNMVRRQLGLPE